MTATISTARVAEDSGTTVVTPDDLPWAEWMEGLHVKILRCNPDTNEYTMMVRFAPGVELPRHRHLGPVHGYTVQGRWKYLEYDWEAVAGSYVFEPASSTHTLKVFDDNAEDTITIFTMQGGIVLLDDEGQVWMYEDAESALERYREALEQQGIAFPEGRVLS